MNSYYELYKNDVLSLLHTNKNNIILEHFNFDVELVNLNDNKYKHK